MKRVLTDDPELAVWWASELECLSAVMREERARELSRDEAVAALERLGAIAEQWIEVEPTERVRALARRLLRTHPLRSADALQLAAGIVAGEGEPEGLGFVSFDDRLVDAARREGFAVVEPA